MPTLTDKFILSDPSQLKRIKRHQYLMQAVPVLLILISFAIGSRPLLYIPAILLAGLGAGLFILIGAAHRFHQRIPIPEAGMFVSPIQGKLRYSRGNNEISVVNIGRVFLDSVELRSPHPAAEIQDGQLSVPTPYGTITLRFNKAKVTWFKDPDFTRGNVIGMIWGHGSCTISIPARVLGADQESSPDELIIPKVGKALDICDPLFQLSDPPKAEPAGQQEHSDLTESAEDHA